MAKIEIFFSIKKKKKKKKNEFEIYKKRLFRGRVTLPL